MTSSASKKWRVGVAQIAPVYFNSWKTWKKLEVFIRLASERGVELITWGETLFPGYPSWLSVTGGAQFDDEEQKATFALYWKECLELDGPVVTAMRNLAKELKMFFMGGITEREGTACYATLLTIGTDGQILGRHRKLKPTFEERLVWADGDGLGLKVYDSPIGKFGGLNCWENWLPLARSALHAQGEIVHVGVWPGSDSLVKDISRFMALEGRSWIVAACGLLRFSDLETVSEAEMPLIKKMLKGFDGQKNIQNGGSIIVNPRGETVAGPLIGEEGIIFADVDSMSVIKERQNLDISGHYSRKDVLKLEVRPRSFL